MGLFVGGIEEFYEKEIIKVQRIREFDLGLEVSIRGEERCQQRRMDIFDFFFVLFFFKRRIGRGEKDNMFFFLFN